jgi:GDPmannose 4,6-dehydratase
VATGRQHSVREFAELAFDRVGLDWRRHVESEESRFRPADVDTLCGDSGKARKVLGWEPEVSFEELVAMMVDHDMDVVARQQALPEQRGVTR